MLLTTTTTTTTITTLFTSLFSLASARIIDFTIPETIAPDTEVKFEILTENYIQSITDVAISFGLSRANTSFNGTLGTYLRSKYLGPDLSNSLENITHYVHVPATTAKGAVVISTAHFQLLGRTLSPDLENYAVNVTVGDSTSGEYVASYRVEDS